MVRERFTQKWKVAVSAIFASTVFLSGHCLWHESETVVNTISWGKLKKGGPYGQFVIHWRNESTVGGCNYSSLYLPETERFYFVTARHCMVPPSQHEREDFFANDIHISEWLSDNRRVVISSDEPKSYLPSRYDVASVNGKKLLVVGGLPDGIDGMTSLWFSISGRAKVFQDWVVAIKMPSQQFFQMGKLQGKTSIGGMSGSPVLDDEGKLFWVLSMAYKDKSDYAIIFPLRYLSKRK